MICANVVRCRDPAQVAEWAGHTAEVLLRLASGARERWPQLDGITVRWHGEFAYVAGQLAGGTTLP